MKKNLYLFQPQYSINYNNEQNYWLPYSVGCLWAYANQFDDIQQTVELQELIFRREPIANIIDRMEPPDACGFSCYAWNEKWNLNAAQAIKERWPTCKIIFGGPQTHVSYLEKYSFVDCIASGEGEVSFTEFLRDIVANKPIKDIYTSARIEELDIPSPYLTGVFDKIMAAHPDAFWDMTWETNRGCPYQCTFCDWGSLTYSKVKKFPMERLKAELEWLAKNRIAYMFLADANFGIFKERDLEIAYMLKDLSTRSYLESINIQFAKNSSDTVYEIGRVLGPLSRGITMSVQSMNDDTLEAIKRKNLPNNNVRHLMDLSQQTGVSTYTEVILGLPLETVETWKQGLANILEMGQHNSLDVWFAQLLVNSELGQPESREKYQLETVRAKDYFPQFDPNDWRDILEEIEIVRKTSTMTTDDIVLSYLYAWLYIQFHFTGYSQIYARYCRNISDVSYYDFYETMFKMLKDEPWLMPHFNMLKESLEHYLAHGVLINIDQFKAGGLGHGFHSVSYTFLYQHRKQCFALGEKVVQQLLGRCPAQLKTLQELYMFDIDLPLPIKIDLPFDPINWKDQESTIEISSKLDDELLQKISKKYNSSSYTNTGDNRVSFDLYAARRKGWLKNHLELVKTVAAPIMPKQMKIPIKSLT